MALSMSNAHFCLTVDACSLAAINLLEVIASSAHYSVQNLSCAWGDVQVSLTSMGSRSQAQAAQDLIPAQHRCLASSKSVSPKLKKVFVAAKQRSPCAVLDVRPY